LLPLHVVRLLTSRLFCTNVMPPTIEAMAPRKAMYAPAAENKPVSNAGPSGR
jgi:hypothetical protein